ncbi:ribose-5-phosphate isomerase RpiA [Marinicella sp. S1101]|uniref:ribose-5-phosphate isomerase RpiA n=1 Tax=Marinicella marina TaxID=2996016 RepID=UPI0022608753|nr:ribose-5-phosphate isomerase RpiA [Marinicella marina]MCX7553773.1 ribose-5-phosphate isomerase RpiA [Marinicella marina]MDJ1140848.1 ribose-5-phosphate isomerase RpiA [Marinicella marina]
MSTDQLKIQAATAALEYIKKFDYKIDLGVGTGSTVNELIALLPSVRHHIDAVVSSSEESTKRLEALEFNVKELNQTGDLTLYIDGADECDGHNRLIKGGGGALTREKIIAASSRQFICIVDQTKMVDVLGKFPLPVEVIPMARSYVARQMVKLGGQPIYRDGFVTDNDNQIIDVHNLKILDPVKLESKINQIPGVITNGLFALRKADLTLVAQKSGEIIKQ